MLQIFLYLTLLSSCGLINPSTLTFENVNLMEAMDVILLLLWNTTKNGCKNPYLQCKSFKSTFKPISHLTSISRRCPVTLSIHIFANTKLTKTMTNLLIVWKMYENVFSNNSFSVWPYKFVQRFWQYLTLIYINILHHHPLSRSKFL